MFKLRVAKQEPNCLLDAILIFLQFAFKVIKDRNWLFGFFLSFELFVLLDDSFSVLKFLLVLCYLIIWESDSTEALEERHDILRSEIIFSKADKFK